MVAGSCAADRCVSRQAARGQIQVDLVSRYKHAGVKNVIGTVKAYASKKSR
jgi:hypothetical protein